MNAITSCLRACCTCGKDDTSSWLDERNRDDSMSLASKDTMVTQGIEADTMSGKSNANQSDAVNAKEGRFNSSSLPAEPSFSSFADPSASMANCVQFDMFERWESLMKEYEDLEYDYVQEHANKKSSLGGGGGASSVAGGTVSISAVIASLRRSPKEILRSPLYTSDAALRKLAHIRMEILSTHDPSASSGGAAVAQWNWSKDTTEDKGSDEDADADADEDLGEIVAEELEEASLGEAATPSSAAAAAAASSVGLGSTPPQAAEGAGEALSRSWAAHLSLVSPAQGRIRPTLITGESDSHAASGTDTGTGHKPPHAPSASSSSSSSSSSSGSSGGGTHTNARAPSPTSSTQPAPHAVVIHQKWPVWLVDESFEVVKVNAFGKKYDRILKLTQYHILGASTMGISKVNKYGDIKDVRVDLTADNESITLYFRSDKSSIKYMTPMCAHIAQQLTTRMQLRRRLDHAAAAGDSESSSSINSSSSSLLTCSSTLVQGMIQRIGASNMKSKSSVTMSFAEALVEKLVPYSNETSLDGNRVSRLSRSTLAAPLPAITGAAGTGAGAGTSSSSSAGTVSDSRGSVSLRAAVVDSLRLNDTRNVEQLADGLVIVSPGSKEFYVEKAVQRLVLENRSKEYSTRMHFVRTMQARLKEAIAAHARSGSGSGSGSSGSSGSGGKGVGAEVAQEIRMWIEGMHEYILMRRGPSLATIYIMATSESSAAGSAGIRGTMSSSISGSGSSSTDIRAADIAAILDKHLQHQDTVESGSGKLNDEAEGKEQDQSFNPLTFLNHSTLLVISYICYSVVEEAVYLPLKASLLDCMNLHENMHARDKEIHKKIISLQHMSQEQWGIPIANQSPLEWKSAIFELNACELCPTPSRSILAIVATAKSIFAEYEANNANKANVAALGADDLVPIFIYVLVRAGLKTPLLNRSLLWGICHPSQLYGESGYYLTVYESAVLYIEQYGVQRTAEEEEGGRGEGEGEGERDSKRDGSRGD